LREKRTQPARKNEMVREKYKYVIPFRELRIQDVPKVGGKNASLGEMVAGLAKAGVSVPDGFATTADAYWHFLDANEGLLDDMRKLLEGAEGAKLHRDVRGFEERGKKLRQMVRAAKVPEDLVEEIKDMYQELSKLAGMEEDSEGAYVAVRSSATAEDLPNASFAGQQDSFLHVHGVKELIERWVDCCASLFTARAITYRHDMGFDHMAVALSVGVQIMVRADTGSSGVMFTLDPESGYKDVVLVQGIYGLGENIVQGRVGPDEFLVHKPTLKQGFKPLVRKQCGPKEMRMVYNAEKRTLVNLSVPEKERKCLSVSDEEVLLLARWGMQIEEHYGNKPMDIEWAKDGDTGKLYIVQARPETIHSRSDINVYRQYTRKKEQKIAIEVLAEGIAVGNNIGYGTVRVIESPKQIDQFQPGEILVTSITDPAWDPILKDAGAIITERGGRTSHAAIVAREMGIPAIVGAEGARKSLSDGMEITVSCCEGDRGKIYKGKVDFSVVEIDVRTLKETRTKIMLNIARPDKALAAASLPCDGVGLCRMEFVFADHIGIHPLALTRFTQMPKDVQTKIKKMMEGHGPYNQPKDFFVDMLAQGVGTLVAAFYPRPVILRMSDLKTNEYAQLVGGSLFEPKEENPMIGWRGASRYYHKDYKEGFMLEIEAVKKIREEFGLTNLKVMIPFCRTPEEGKKVIETMAEAGLTRDDGLEIYVMAEIPSNIWMAEEFCQHFDGFSIGSNDLTQLTLGIDRDAERIYPLFDECNKAVKDSCALLIKKAHEHDPPRKVGICGQAPSDHPDFAAFLVEHGIDTISLNTDAVVSTKQSIIEKEAALDR